MRKIRYSGRTLFFSSFVVSTERRLVAASVPRSQAQPWLVSKPTSNWKKNISAVATENSLSHTKCYPIMSGEFCLSLFILFFPGPTFPNPSPQCADPIVDILLYIPWLELTQVLTPLKAPPEGVVICPIPADHPMSDVPCPLDFTASPNFLD